MKYELLLSKNIEILSIVKNGKAQIAKIDNKYYYIEQDPLKYKGQIYLQEVEILDNE
jgi:hypothetical protein